jgi:hypothetical protein
MMTTGMIATTEPNGTTMTIVTTANSMGVTTTLVTALGT